MKKRIPNAILRSWRLGLMSVLKNLSKKKHTIFKKAIIILLLLCISFAAYVAIVNRNSRQMTARQKILKAIYPVFMWFNNRAANKDIYTNQTSLPSVSFYSLTDTTIDGDRFDFSQLKGRKILIVNTASDCGYTAQYDDLEELHNRYKNKLVVIGFPANDFKEQEKGTNEEIAKFCKKNFGVSFILMKKTSVIKSADQNNVFKWLTDPAKNGWNDKRPDWNFSKYLVNENGMLTNYFSPAVSPLNSKVLKAIAE